MNTNFNHAFTKELLNQLDILSCITSMKRYAQSILGDLLAKQRVSCIQQLLTVLHPKSESPYMILL